MAETSYPFDAQSVTEAQWAALFAMVQQNGVDGEPASTDLLPFGDSTGMNVKVNAGTAWIRGSYYNNDATITKTVTANSSGSPRMDLVVVQRSLSGDASNIVVKAGTPAGSPSPPALTQVVGGVWEIPLGTVLVPNGAVTIPAVNVVDARAFLELPTLLARSQADIVDPVKVGTQLFTTSGGPKLWYWDGTAWRQVALVQGVSWIPFPLAGGSGVLIPQDTTPAYTIEYGQVRFRGSIRRSSGAPLVASGGVTNPILGTMPVGYRPSSIRRFNFVTTGPSSANFTARGFVASDGTVGLYTDGFDVNGVFIDSISYIAEA